MLFAVMLLAGLANAARYCFEVNEQLPENLVLPECTKPCLGTDTSVLDGVCADNLKDICGLDGGVASYFRVYTACLSRECSAIADRKEFVKIFQTQCGWYPDITDTQARYFGDWKIYLVDGRSTHSQASSTVIQRITSFVTVTSPSTSDAESTSTKIESNTTSTSELFLEPSFTTQTAPATTADTSTSIQDDESSPTLHTSAFSASSSSASSLPLAQDEPQSALSTPAIAGVAIGGILAFALICGIVFFFMRRCKHDSRPLSPPVYEPSNGKMAREKAGLDEPYSSVGVGGPVGFAELDGRSPASPVVEPVHLSMSKRRVTVAQNF
ncbi:uncharacterized protein M421DRAFT_7617 [Didymella exigua CBS 183.55]|uniref:Uncharacterized protein n=1 Tax=Didymella exigua CBS 183.55 TaxID=1150837 RepID=A0A6A5RFH5_9PLEO|nr:uncharacterized protein M421DRAFT_7617 [Didymella exigua CBS 183.55]KAF1925854.1 hypothetical protein M421DRAFT_7617 [Didymella exigua CBS 183.55]